MIFMILAVTKVTAQDTFVVFEKEVRTYSVDEHIGSTYQWSVFAMTDLNTEIINSSIVEFVSGKTSKEVEINWKQAGDYILVIEEFGPCQNLKAHKVSVVTTPTIEFKELASDDCADADNSFATELIAMFDSGTELAESQYPVTVNYRLDGDAADRTATITYADKMLNVLGIIEDENKETINNITIISATNKYGGTLNIIGGKEVHVRTIYALPAKPVITVKN
ncbi:hypothetical protein DF185_20575 [Marinifilum breve]|uniref:Uncharacterized protein n=2 Tax=Marinifilum breve TaxID=2184082 RepID=A0A2V3ZSR2_9BACT|nr:hypothetical protein DF185_20575 [Marinifilum breve]